MLQKWEGYDESQQRMNQLGAEGWEAVGITWYGGPGIASTGYYVLLKRPLEA
jgi:hypothetical protein